MDWELVVDWISVCIDCEVVVWAVSVCWEVVEKVGWAVPVSSCDVLIVD